jgi:hypothetical protein
MSALYCRIHGISSDAISSVAMEVASQNGGRCSQKPHACAPLKATTNQLVQESVNQKKIKSYDQYICRSAGGTFRSVRNELSSERSYYH